jgi:hypothetical protein
VSAAWRSSFIKRDSGETRRRLFVPVGAPIGHAQLDQCVTRLFAFAAGAQHVNNATHIGNGALRLSGLGARRTALLVEREALPCVQRFRVRLGQRDRAIQPVQGIAHREQPLRLLAGEDQVVERLRPGVRALVVLRQLGIAFVRGVFAVAFQRLCHRLVQLSAPRPADVAINHFAKLVVTEVVYAALGLLTQQTAPDERLHRIEQLRLGLVCHVEQGIEVETPADDRGGFEQRPDRPGHVREPHAQGGAQRVREQPRRAARARFQARLALAQGMQDRHQEERIAFGFAMQALGQSGFAEVRVDECRDQTLGIGITQPGERHATCLGVAPQALDQLGEPLVTVDGIVTIGVDHEHRALRGVARKEMQHLRAGVIGPLDIVHHEHGRTIASPCLKQLVHRTGQACLPRLGKIVRQLRQVRNPLADLGNQGGEFGERHGRQGAQRRGRYAVERTRDEVDHGLVRDRALDLVAVRRERRQVLGMRVARDLTQQSALADSRLAFDQDSEAGACGEPRGEPDEQAVLVISADEGRCLAGGGNGRGR